MGISSSRRLRRRTVLILAIGLFAAALAVPASAAALSSAGGPWLWQNPLPTGLSMRSVDFVDASHGWAVGGRIVDSGVYATTDGGKTWALQFSFPENTESGFLSVEFFDADHGWAVGDVSAGYDGPRRGVVLTTVDGGANWTQHTLVDFYPSAVVFTDEMRGWAVGEGPHGGCVKVTSDGGATWATEYTCPSWVLLESITAADATHAWAVGNEGTIVATSDGTTWVPQSSRTVVNLTDVTFSSVTRGWAVGDEGTVLATVDGGGTWTHQSAGAAFDYLEGVDFADAMHGWVVGYHSDLDSYGYPPIAYSTSDGGSTWVARSFGAATPLRAVDFIDANVGWVTGELGAFSTTADGGATWQTPGLGNAFMFSCIDVVDTDHAWAAGSCIEPNSGLTGGATIVATRDGGVTWTTQNPGTSAELRAIDFDNTLVGLAVGSQHDDATGRSTAVIVRSADGGATWTPANPGISDDLLDVAFGDAIHAWAVGGHYDRAIDRFVGVVLASQDGGTTWSRQSVPVQSTFTGVTFTDATHGWVCDMSGEVLATANAGSTWAKQNTGLQTTRGFGALTAITFRDANHGWAVSNNGAIITTIDGGATWTRRYSGTSASLRSVTFVDVQHGWAAGNFESGIVLSTSDGGLTWGGLGVPPGGVEAISFADATHGWGVGFAGTILATDPAADLTPPTFAAAGFASGVWSKSPLGLGFSGADEPGGSGLSGFVYSIDARQVNLGPTTTSIALAAPSTHAKDGAHSLICWSADKAGNTSPKKAFTYVIDTLKPAPTAYAATAYRGHWAKLPYRVADWSISGNVAKSVTIYVKNPAGKLVRTIRLANRSVNRTQLAALAVPKTWARGAYRVYVYATDRAGNRQARPGVSRLTIR